MNRRSKKTLFTTILATFALGIVACNDDAPKHVHTFSSDWTYNSEEHWHEAICGHDVTSGNAAHTFDEWIIDREAEPYKKGLKHHVCEVCQYVAYEEIVYQGMPRQVYVSTHSASLFRGYTYSLSPVVIPNNSYKNIKYEVGNESVLRVIDDTVYGDNVGTSIVYIYNDNDDDNIRDEEEPYTVMAFSITEPDPAVVITVNGGNPIMASVGESKTISVSVAGASPSGFDYGYYSENEEICTVAGGILKAHKAGNARIFVSWQGYRGYCDVTVNNFVDGYGTRASSIELDEGDIILNKGQTHEILSHLLPTETVDTISSYSSNNERVAQVDSRGVVTALSGGSAVITLTSSNGLTNRILVLVKDPQDDDTNYYNNYYGNLTWENAGDLIEKLHTIINTNVTHLAYKTGSANWESNQYADQDLYDYSYVYSVYTDNKIAKSATGTWQREHAFAASLMTGYSTGDAVTARGRATDFHNLFAAHGQANGSRGNKNFGYANPKMAGYATKENCAYRKNAWEPKDIDKGRLARAIFYMGVMYNTTDAVEVSEKWTFDKEHDPSVMNEENKSKTVKVYGNEKPIQILEEEVGYNKLGLDGFMYPLTEQDITLVNYYRNLVRAEDPDLETSNYERFRIRAYEIYTDNSVAYSIGHLSDLLKWNSFDVDLVEMQHNNSVYSHNASAYGGTQENRNPFVDYPQLVDYVYGDLQDQPGDIHDLIPSYLTLEMDKDEIHHYAYDSANEVSYVVGESPSIEDFPIKAIKNDLSEGTVDPNKVYIDEYTFTEDDVVDGKNIVVHTDLNDITVHVNVNSQAVVKFDDCTYSFRATSGLNDPKYVTGSEKSYVFTLNGQQFDVTLGSATTYIRNITDGGITMGSSGSPITSFKLETRNSFNNINAAYIAMTASPKASLNYKIFVNDVVVYQGATENSSDIGIYGGMFTASSGKIKFEFASSVQGFKFAGLAFNYAVE